MTHLICCGLCNEFSELGDREAAGLCYKKSDYVGCMEKHPECFDKSKYVGEKTLSQIALTLKPKTSQELIDLVSWSDKNE